MTHEKRKCTIAVVMGTLAFIGITGMLVKASALSGPVGYHGEVDRPATANLQPGRAQNSPLLAQDPTNARFLTLAYRVDAPDFSCGLELSGDGGASWVPAEPVPTLPSGAEKCYAPEVAFAADGTLYYLFVGLQGEGNSPMGAFLTTSADRGRTFSQPWPVLGPERYMVRMAIDGGLGEAGRLHLAWLEARSDPPLGGLPPPPNPIVASYSDDGGRSFSEPTQVSHPERARVAAPALAIGPDHEVHVIYYDLQEDARDYQGLEGPPWPEEWSLVLSTSTDSGESFPSDSVVDAGLIPPGRVMLIFTMPPPSLVADGDGRVFAAWHDARNGDWDAFIGRSEDGGRTWSAPQRLNDDPMGPVRHQYLPRLAVAPDGRIDAVFIDRRRDPQNLRNDVFYTSSFDHGASFAENIRLTSESSPSEVGQRYAVRSAEGLVEFGSRIALLSNASEAVAAWTDTRNAGDPRAQNVYATSILVEDSRRWLTGIMLGVFLVSVGAATGYVVARARAQGQA